MLHFDSTDLFVDEAQYWFGRRNIDFGYYSKPPMIAWVIRDDRNFRFDVDILDPALRTADPHGDRPCPDEDAKRFVSRESKAGRASPTSPCPA
jgi:hypothetical protein